MATVLKCKMCGGDIEVNQNMTIGTCQYCGSTMTLPKIESEKKARLFNIAHEYRLNCEYDKAYDAYKTIATEDEQEAEAYWGMILSEYGIEYVEDPSTHKRVPTCHRVKVQSIQSSVHFQNAIKYADAERKFMYQDEAEELDRLQRDILAKSSAEEPYDVFICYKENDDVTGERAQDSVIAQEIYQALTDKGIRVFFARISLRNHLGENYEPYIFAALNSARVMLHVSTSTEHSNAVWVKNEWSRYIQLMQEHREKVLIPIYKDISPYQLPRQMSNYQAQDISKVGALQDLIAGIEKILGRAITETGNQALNDLIADKLKREDEKRKWKKRIKKTSIVTCAIAVVVAIVVVIAACIYQFWYYPEEYVNKPVYEKAVSLMKEENYKEAIYYLTQLDEEYRDCKTLLEECQLGIYEKALALMAEENYDDAEYYLTQLDEDYKDCRNLLIECRLESVKTAKDYSSALGEFIETYAYDDFNEELKTMFDSTVSTIFYNSLTQSDGEITGGQTVIDMMNLLGETYGNEQKWELLYACAFVEYALNRTEDGSYEEAIEQVIALKNVDGNEEFYNDFISKMKDTLSEYKNRLNQNRAFRVLDCLKRADAVTEDEINEICSVFYNNWKAQNVDFTSKSCDKFESVSEDLDTLKTLSDYQYEDSQTLYENALESMYTTANNDLTNRRYNAAQTGFGFLENYDYKDSAQKKQDAKDAEAQIE